MSVVCLSLLKRISAPLIIYHENLWSTLSLDTTSLTADKIMFPTTFKTSRVGVFLRNKKKNHRKYGSSA